MNDPIFNIPQQSLTPLLGISTEQLRGLRRKILAADVHFKNDGNRVWYSQAGVDRLRAELDVKNSAPEKTASPDAPTHDLPPPPPAPSPAKKTPRRVICLPDKLEDLTELVVYRTPVNQRILEAVRPEADTTKKPATYRVQVRNNVNFTSGMRVPVRHVAGDLFEFTGRLPRWRGKY